jgi:hypothetical protein
MYCTGGLEPDDKNSRILKVGGVEYVVGNKFRTMLRDSFINWGTFLEIYNKNINYINTFDQVVKLLNIKENENLRDSLIPIVKTIYNLPADAHIACLMKQFMLYEPVSIAVHTLFMTFKSHFERIVELFVKKRNEYIAKNKIKAKQNNWKELVDEWNDLNLENELDTSSVILLFLNPPKNLNSHLHYKATPESEALKAAVKNFKYPGFCPKIPHRRLLQLLCFPIKEFVEAIHSFDSSIVFPDYAHIQSKMQEIIQSQPKKPEIKDEIEREEPPEGLVAAAEELSSPRESQKETHKETQAAKIKLVQWYVDKILDLRKKLFDYGKAYEDYYINSAEVINNITDMVKEEINKASY